MPTSLAQAIAQPSEPKTVEDQDGLALWHPEHRRSPQAEECVRSIRRAMSIILEMQDSDAREVQR